MILLRFIFVSIFCQSLVANEDHFFARHVHPLTLTPDGKSLLAVNSAEGRISVFAIGEDRDDAPTLTAEIPVGLLPVSVRMRTPDEAWIINELSDSVSIISLSRRAVIATLQTGDEPADVAFAKGKAFVTCSRDNSLEVFDPLTHQKIDTIALQGLLPRMIIPSADGSALHTIFLHTSNGTTILPRTVAPPQQIPANINPALPTPPQVAQIVPTSHASIDYNVLDHDLATIDPVSHRVTSYHGGLGTNILSLAALPSGDFLIGNTEARNLISLEPNLKSRFTFTQLAHLSDGQVTQQHLNPDPDVTFPEILPDTLERGLSQVFEILPSSDGSSAWLASFGTDRIARYDLASQAVTSLVDLRSGDDPNTPRSASTVRGPRGLVNHPTLPKLYVLNRLSHTLSTIDTEELSILSELPLASHLDLAPEKKTARAFLFDARHSGTGTVSCASCHLDLERDGMAWDLGDPSAEMLTVKGALLSLHLPDTFVDRPLHPMKGPLITQTLIGLSEQTKLHWRGDKPSIQSFNSTFPNLLGSAPLASAEMDQVAAYLNGLQHHPNPHLELDRNLPEMIEDGVPADGIAVFTLFDNHCSACHQLPSGTSNNLDIPSTFGSFQAIKDAPLRTTYHRNHFNPISGESSLTGFGLGSDGSQHELPLSHPYSLHILDDINRPLATREKEKRDLAAFILSFDTGTAPAVGHSVTLTNDAPPSAAAMSEIATLEAQANLKELSGVGLVVRGIFKGKSQSFQYLADSRLYRSSIDQSRTDLLEGMQAGDSLTFTGVPIGALENYSLDRNRDGTPDDDLPPPVLHFDHSKALHWPSARADWLPESSSDFLNWAPVLRTPESNGSQYSLSDPTTATRKFYRLRRTW